MEESKINKDTPTSSLYEIDKAMSIVLYKLVRMEEKLDNMQLKLDEVLLDMQFQTNNQDNIAFEMEKNLEKTNELLEMMEVSYFNTFSHK